MEILIEDVTGSIIAITILIFAAYGLVCLIQKIADHYAEKNNAIIGEAIGKLRYEPHHHNSQGMGERKEELICKMASTILGYSESMSPVESAEGAILLHKLVIRKLHEENAEMVQSFEKMRGDE